MRCGYGFRLYPDAAQREQIELTLGCCRWVYNKGLEVREAAYKAGAPAGTDDTIKMIPGWKKEFPWLEQADSAALQQSLRHLGRAYGSFFGNVRKGRIVGKRRDRKTGRIKNPYGHPVFKRKRGARQSYRTTNISGKGIAVLDGSHIKLPKLDPVKARISRPVQGRIVSATVKRTPTGKYFCSLQCEGAPPSGMGAGGVDVMGVDAGIKDLAVCSDGTRYANPKSLKKAEKKLSREQRRLARKQKGSKNRERQRLKVARCHEQVADRRKDALHKATTAIICESQAVAVEDLNVKGMMADRRLAKSAADASMGELLRQLRYKAEWYGRGYVEVGRWFPSSRLCGECGYVHGGLTLSMRAWECPQCGALHDRDLDAARNIADEGRRILREGTAGHAGTAAATRQTLAERA